MRERKPLHNTKWKFALKFDHAAAEHKSFRVVFRILTCL